MSLKKGASVQPFEEFNLEWIEVADLRVDHDYQRPLNNASIRKIAEHFDPLKFGTLAVSERDEVYFVVDGQQRFHAIKMRFGPRSLLPCIVYRELETKDEAAQFIGLNDSTSVAAIDKFKARCAAGDPVACDIRKIIRNRGLNIARSPSDGHIACVAQCERIYLGGNKQHGKINPAALGETLSNLLAIWGPEKTAFNGNIVTGLGWVVLRYRMQLDQDRLVDKIKAKWPNATDLLHDARKIQSVEGRSVFVHVADQIIKRYNVGIRTKNLQLQFEFPEEKAPLKWSS